MIERSNSDYKDHSNISGKENEALMLEMKIYNSLIYDGTLTFSIKKPGTVFPANP